MTKKQVLKYFGSYAEIARVLNISRSAAHQWGKYPPLLRQYQLAKVTKGDLKITLLKDEV